MNTEDQHQRRDPGSGLALSPQEFRLLLVGLIITLFLSALDNTIVGTAMPTIVGEFGGLARYTWVTTAYIITSTISTLVLGKLSDLYGRRKVYLLTIGGFLAASALCGMAQNMDQLIAFRALQGLGGGGIMGLTFAIIGDVVPMRDRGRYFGLFTGVFAIAGVAGPLVGGLIVDNTSWRWIFYVNLPLGLLAITMVVRTLKLPHVTRTVRLDVLGAVLLSATICALMIPLEFGSTEGWTSPGILLSFVAAALLLAGFVWQERRAPEAILPPRLFSHDIVRTSMLLALLAGAVMMTGSLFISMWFQFVRFMSPTEAGLSTMPVMIGITFSSAITGRLISKWGVYKRFPLMGLPLLLAGYLLTTRIGPDTHVIFLSFAMLLMGLGMGLTMPTISIANQNSADPRDLGIATSAGNFFRNLGSAIGLAAYGSIFNAVARSELRANLPADQQQGDVLAIIRQPDRVEQMSQPVIDAIHEAISRGVVRVFEVSCVVLVACMAVALVLREEPLRRLSGVEMRQMAAE